MNRTYKIQPRSADLGDGWHLKLYENNQEAGGGVYPIREEDPHVGMEWWNGLPETRRAHWLIMAASAMPAAARHAYLLAEAYNDAMGEGESWSACNCMSSDCNRQLMINQLSRFAAHPNRCQNINGDWLRRNKIYRHAWLVRELAWMAIARHPTG